MVTADLKYHDFFQAENQILLVDGGHYETERFTKKLIHDHLIEKLPNFAIALSKSITNPVSIFPMAKKNEVTVEDKLRALYDLQLIDSRVDEIRNVRGNYHSK